jgi:hypothetical protein
VALRWAKAAKKRQKVALARLILGWQDVRKMNASQKTNSPSPAQRQVQAQAGAPKTKFLSS